MDIHRLKHWLWRAVNAFDSVISLGWHLLSLYLSYCWWSESDSWQLFCLVPTTIQWLTRPSFHPALTDHPFITVPASDILWNMSAVLNRIRNQTSMILAVCPTNVCQGMLGERFLWSIKNAYSNLSFYFRNRRNKGNCCWWLALMNVWCGTFVFQIVGNGCNSWIIPFCSLIIITPMDFWVNIKPWWQWNLWAETVLTWSEH